MISSNRSTRLTTVESTLRRAPLRSVRTAATRSSMSDLGSASNLISSWRCTWACWKPSTPAPMTT